MTAIFIMFASAGCTSENIGHKDTTTETTLNTHTPAEKPHYTNDGIACEPIDKTLDCEAILLEKAEELCRLMRDYLNIEESMLAYKIGEPFNMEYRAAKVYSDEMKCYADFKDLFSGSIYGAYFDYINTASSPSLLDIDGELYRQDHEGGYLGTLETWYIGCDVYDDRIIGHFAELRGMGEPEEVTAEYLNDESHYWFYDITVQKLEGKYVITDCRETTSSSGNAYYKAHGLFYNSGNADRRLITNDNVKPKFLADKLQKIKKENRI